MDSLKVTLAEAATRFSASLPPGEREKSQKELGRFVRWYGRDRAIAELTIPEVDDYADKATLSGADPAELLMPVKAFLSYARKEGLIKVSLASHMKMKKIKAETRVSSKRAPQRQSISPEGLAQLKSELDTLQKERRRVAEKLRLAAADKDFRENAPLDAARDEQGHLEGKIRKIESMLVSTVVIDESKKSQDKLEMGDTVLVKDLSTAEEMRYTLVHPSQVNLAKGKISIASPLVKALLGHTQGEVVKVIAPVGAISYQILQIEP